MDRAATATAPQDDRRTDQASALKVQLLWTNTRSEGSLSDGEEQRRVARVAIRRVERRVPGLGVCVFRAPSVGADMRLTHYYEADGPDVRSFVNEVFAAVVETRRSTPRPSTG